MNEETAKANYLKLFIIIIIFIIIISGGIGFYFAQGWLRQLTIDTNSAVAEANKISSTKTNLTTVNDPETKDLANRTINMIYSDNNFQAQVTRDLNIYANNTGITITNVSLAPDIIESDEDQLDLFGDLDVKKISISIGSPVSFTNLMQFIKRIETNTPKIQINKISLSNVRANSGDVTVEPIIIEVYTK